MPPTNLWSSPPRCPFWLPAADSQPESSCSSCRFWPPWSAVWSTPASPISSSTAACWCLICFLSFSIYNNSATTSDHFMLPASICSATCLLLSGKISPYPPLIAHLLFLPCCVPAPCAFCCFLAVFPAPAVAYPFLFGDW
ncbi:hypothetical protein SORBI_3002G010150 [Sorghum bicolor]|uniref:Uncharacterized protein n=1 Tax=Sorghum bicolor TaxID=4558 RepID=A0A1W0W1Q0_SORBI|nr:hypothetical protein SORBI_3002G010150 [Sorghum bicolor]